MSDAEFRELQNAIILHLLQEPDIPVSSGKLGHALNGNKRAIGAALHKLAEEGRVLQYEKEKPGPAQWTLMNPDKERADLGGKVVQVPDRFGYTGGKVPKGKTATVRAEPGCFDGLKDTILAALSSGGTKTVYNLVQQLKCQKPQVNAALYNLAQSGDVVQEPGSQPPGWSLTESGIARAASLPPLEEMSVSAAISIGVSAAEVPGAGPQAIANLNLMAQQKRWTVRYEDRGMTSAGKWAVVCFVNGTEFPAGASRNKKEAKQVAAAYACAGMGVDTPGGGVPAAPAPHPVAAPMPVGGGAPAFGGARFCPECGEPLAAVGAKFCMSCGSAVL